MPTRKAGDDLAAAFSSNEQFREFLNTNKGFYDIRVPDITSPQFKENPLSYFDDDGEFVNPELNKALQKAGGTKQEIDFLHKYIGMEDRIRENKKQYGDAKKSITSLIGKTIESGDPSIRFRPDETLYRGSRASADRPSPGIGDVVEFDRFRSTSPDPELAEKFAVVDGGNAYLDSETAKRRFGEGNRGRFEVIEPLHGGLRLGNPFEGEDQEVLVKPGKFKVIDKKILERSNFENIEFLKYKQIQGLDPAATAFGGGVDLLRRNAAGAVAGAAFSAMNPEVAKQVERGQYGRAATSVGREVTLGAVTEAAMRAAAPVAQRIAPSVVRTAAPVLRVAAPLAAGTALFNQGRTGSLTDVMTRKAAKVLPGLKPNPKTDLGRKAGNELQYIFGSLLGGRLPYGGK